MSQNMRNKYLSPLPYINNNNWKKISIFLTVSNGNCHYFMKIICKNLHKTKWNFPIVKLCLQFEIFYTWTATMCSQCFSNLCWVCMSVQRAYSTVLQHCRTGPLDILLHIEYVTLRSLLLFHNYFRRIFHPHIETIRMPVKRPRNQRLLENTTQFRRRTVKSTCSQSDCKIKDMVLFLVSYDLKKWSMNHLTLLFTYWRTSKTKSYCL